MNWDLLPQHEDQYNMALLTDLHRKETEEMVSITLLLNNILERMILKNVDQWIWTHDRWKS